MPGIAKLRVCKSEHLCLVILSVIHAQGSKQPLTMLLSVKLATSCHRTASLPSLPGIATFSVCSNLHMSCLVSFMHSLQNSGELCRQYPFLVQATSFQMSLHRLIIHPGSTKIGLLKSAYSLRGHAEHHVCCTTFLETHPTSFPLITCTALLFGLTCHQVHLTE